MKALGLAAAASCLLAAPLAAAPAAVPAAAPLASFGSTPGAAIVPVAMGDDPAARPRRGGGRKHKAAAATTAGTPKLENGETTENAQKAYQKKYGF